MAGFQIIAVELIDHCLSFLAKEDWIALSATCKRMRNFCQPLIYREIDLVWKQVNTGVHGPQMHLLLRSFIENPSQSTHTVTVSLHAIGFRKSTGSRAPIVVQAPISSDLDIISKAVIESNVPWLDIWIDAVAAGRLDTMMTLFIIRLSKLKRLCIGLDLLYRDSFLGAGLKHVLNSAPDATLACWPDLEHVSLGMDLVPDHYSDCMMLSKINQYTPFFYLPKLVSAGMLMPDICEQPSPTRTTWVSWKSQENWTWQIRSRPCAEQLTSLNLKYTRASPSMLDHILQATPNLSILDYTCKCRVWSAIPFECIQVGRALRHVQATLCDLTVGLIFYRGDAGDYGDQGDEYIRGSLQGFIKDFTKLASLEIAPVVLWGWDGPAAGLAAILPGVLKRLSICDEMDEFVWMRWTEEACLRKLESLLNGGIWRTTIPALEEVNWYALENEMYETVLEQRQAFRNLVQGQGLRCSVFKGWPEGRCIPYRLEPG